MKRFLLMALLTPWILSGCGGDGDNVQLDTTVHDTFQPQDVADPGTPGEDAMADIPAEDPGQPPEDLPPVEDPGQPPTDLPPTDLPPTEDPGQVPQDLPPVEDPGQPPEDLPPSEDPGQPPADLPGGDDFPDGTTEPETPAECQVDQDCTDAYIPSVCHLLLCKEGRCVEEPMEDGSPCSDADLCTGPDLCRQGVCTGGSAVDCDDQDPCTEDRCDSTIGCLHDPIERILSCGVGACFREVPFCTNGQVNVCTPGNPVPEACDGIDNDCDGLIDNGNPGAGQPCESDLEGPCKPGRTVCTDGALVCMPEVTPQPEICDRIDNDCDGVVDNNTVGSGASCRTGKPGVCGVGTIFCLDGLLECVQTVQPSAEVCDGLDNNCDGQVDENSPGSGLPCNTGLPGVCSEGITLCTEGRLGCVQTGQPSIEVCDGKDNDCDGLTDPPNSAGCSVFLKDQDGDGYGIALDSQCLCQATAPYTGTLPGDCCDTDPRTRPSATAWFTTPNQCGSFDYNCDNQLTFQYTATGACRFFDFPLNFCEVTEGWVGGIPNCGATGRYLTGCGLGFLTCSQQTTNIPQGCR